MPDHRHFQETVLENEHALLSWNRGIITCKKINGKEPHITSTRKEEEKKKNPHLLEVSVPDDSNPFAEYY
jgi:hypothetical protein